MVKKCKQIYKAYFEKIEKSKRHIIRSSGLIFLYAHMQSTGLIEMLSKRVSDKRQNGKISYQLVDLLSSIILHILDGDWRFSQYMRNPNNEFFKRLFRGNLPHGSSYYWALHKIPGLSASLNRILLRQSKASLISYCKLHGKKSIIIDVDQTAREIHGKQAGVEKGYIAKRRGLKGYQYRLWTFRETKMILKAELLPGSVHSAKDLLPTFKFICKTLKKAGITGVFVGDAGIQSGAACDLIKEQGHYFFLLKDKEKKLKSVEKTRRKKLVTIKTQSVLKKD